MNVPAKRGSASPAAFVIPAAAAMKGRILPMAYIVLREWCDQTMRSLRVKVQRLEKAADREPTLEALRKAELVKLAQVELGIKEEYAQTMPVSELRLELREVRKAAQAASRELQAPVGLSKMLKEEVQTQMTLRSLDIRGKKRDLRNWGEGSSKAGKALTQDELNEYVNSHTFAAKKYTADTVQTRAGEPDAEEELDDWEMEETLKCAGHGGPALKPSPAGSSADKGELQEPDTRVSQIEWVETTAVKLAKSVQTQNGKWPSDEVLEMMIPPLYRRSGSDKTRMVEITRALALRIMEGKEPLDEFAIAEALQAPSSAP